MRSIENILDDYITREDTQPINGKCAYCGELLHDPLCIADDVFCSDECIVDYYKLTKIENIEYCTCCDYSLGEDYIQDPNGDKFCNIECFKKYYR